MNTYYELYHGGQRFTINSFDECISKAQRFVRLGAKSDCPLNTDAFIVKHIQLDGSREQFSIIRVSYLGSDSIAMTTMM